MGNKSFQIKEKISRNHDILDGPSKHTLFEACLHASCSDPVNVPITFCVENGHTAPQGDYGRAYYRLNVENFRIMGIENEDGSGESWNIHGDCNSAAFGQQMKYCRFKAYYNSKKRRGTIQFITNS